MSRVVSPRFITRWAERYLEIRQKEGPDVAQTWGRSFLNPADYGKVSVEIKRIMSTTSA